MAASGDSGDVRRIAAMADIHYSMHSESLRPLLEQVAEQAELLLLCGDLTDNGRPEEAVFHGHAHHGRPEGKTQAGIAVYNVSRGVLHTAFPQQPAFRVHRLA